MANCAGSHVHEKLKEFRLNGKYSDVTILLDGKTFLCHRVVLAAASVYFDTMFGGKFCESRIEELRLYDVHLESFEIILEHAYTGCEPIISEGNICNLLRTSEFLQVQKINDSCTEYILTSMYGFSIEKLLDIHSVACALNIVSLNPLTEYISGNFNTLSQTVAFLQMSFDELYPIMIKYKLSISLPIFRNENFVLDALIRWLYYSYEERKTCFKKLASMVDFQKLSTEYIEHMFEEHEMPPGKRVSYLMDESLIETYILSRDECTDSAMPMSYRDYLHSGNELSLHLSIHASSKELQTMKIFSINEHAPDGFVSCSPRQSTDNILQYGITSDESKYLYCLETTKEKGLTFCAYSSLDMSVRRARTLCPPPLCRQLVGAYEKRMNCVYYYTSATLREDESYDTLFFGRNTSYPMIGSNFSCEDFRTGLFRYSCDTGRWYSITKAGLINKICATLVLSDSLLYLIGGRIMDNILERTQRIVHAYDSREGYWRELPGTASNYHGAKGCSLNGKVYVSNGKSAEMFDPAARRWETLSMEIGGKSCCFMTSYANLVWMCTTRGDDNYAINIYDPSTREWHAPPMCLSQSGILAKCYPELKSLFIHDAFLFKSN